MTFKQIGTIIEVRDITQEKLTEQERKTTEASLRQSKEKYRSIVETANEGI